MGEFQRIVVATDFSGCSHNAIDCACDLADKLGAELHVVHVIHNLALEVPDFGAGLAFPAYLESIPEKKRELTAQVRERMSQELGKRWKQSHRALFAIQYGLPAQEIVEYATQNAIDMIVLGTHGRTGLPHILLGSVAERVMHLAPCPVLVVRSPG